MPPVRLYSEERRGRALGLEKSDRTAKEYRKTGRERDT
jgi:hypothetical protein